MLSVHLVMVTVRLFFPRTACLSFHKLNDAASNRTLTSAVVYDIKELASYIKELVSFINVSRQCNGAAHVLARSAEPVSGAVWFNEVPDLVQDIICNELSVLKIDETPPIT